MMNEIIETWALWILVTIIAASVWALYDAIIIDDDEEITSIQRSFIKRVYHKVISMKLSEIRSFVDHYGHVCVIHTDDKNGLIDLDFPDNKLSFIINEESNEVHIKVNNTLLNMSEDMHGTANKFTIEFIYDVLHHYHFDELLKYR